MRGRIFRRLLVHAVTKYIGESMKTCSSRPSRWARGVSAVIDRRYSASPLITRKILFAVCFIALAILGSTSFAADPKSEIRAVLEAQQNAWNRGDIAAFMDGYWRSDETVFVSSDEVLRGWQKVLERYKRQYSDRKKMGILTFSELEITSLSEDSAVVLGSWRLGRVKDQPHGRFTLIFRRFDDGWKIVHDHTSAAETK